MYICIYIIYYIYNILHGGTGVICGNMVIYEFKSRYSVYRLRYIDYVKDKKNTKTKVSKSK